MSALAALAFEPIPPLGDLEPNGPDMRKAPALSQMLARLDAAVHDPESYARCSLELLGLFGSVGRVIDPNGKESLLPGCVADTQARHRRIWLNAFCDHLLAVGHRDVVLGLVRTRDTGTQECAA